MNRADWAWLMAAIIFGFFFSGLGIFSEVSDGGPRHVPSFNFSTGKWNESVKPPYTRRLTIETNGDVQKMIYAVYDIDPECFSLPSADHPKLASSDYFPIILGSVFGMIMISFLFRIVVKMCLRILDGWPDADETMSNSQDR
jgi:hypothetical protein